MSPIRLTGSIGLFATLLALVLPGAAARADGFIIIERPPVVILPQPIPRPLPPRITHFPLEVRRHIVTCTIRDTVAVTKVDQVFRNPNNQQLDGTYMFPLPENAAVQRFSLWIDGKEVKGELLEADKARQIYEDIVRQTKDPGLLEYVGSRLYRARVFPIPPNGDVRVGLEYSETVPVSDGLATYRYPLNTEKYSASNIEDVAITVEIKSQVPLKTVFCPSHTTTVSRPNDREAKVGFEAHQVKPDKDFVVHYLMTEKEFGLSLLSHRPAGEDGYFLARIAPPFTAAPDKVMPKDVCFVLDTSGSMNGDKIVQAKKALLFCLSSLRKEDRFNLITFATDVRPFRDGLVDARSEIVDAAKAEVNRIEAAGGTSIDDALQAALKAGKGRGGDRPFMIVFITDGEPTVGERDPEKILVNVKKANEAGLRLFVFGVGNDLNAKLLDRLADDNRGAREYIGDKEDIELKVSSFFRKVSDPVLGDIELKFSEADTLDVYPKTLPDLFHGSELVVVGRFRRPGNHTVTMTGKRGGEAMSWKFPANFGESSTENEFLPRLWATRKIGFLMDEIRLRGENRELKEEIVRLAKRHAIVTPYTSYLVIEDTARPQSVAGGLPAPRQPADSLGRMLYSYRDAQPEFRRRLNEAREYGGAGGGRLGVDASKEASSLRGDSYHAANGPALADADGEVMLKQLAPSAAARPEGADRKTAPESPIKTVSGKTFYYDEARWLDSQYDGKAATRKVKAFSDEYFQLLREKPELRKFFALGERVVVVLAGTAYEVTE